MKLTSVLLTVCYTCRLIRLSGQSCTHWNRVDQVRCYYAISGSLEVMIAENGFRDTIKLLFYPEVHYRNFEYQALLPEEECNYKANF